VTTRFYRHPDTLRESGFTLLEAAVAIALIAIAMTAFTMTMSRLNEQASITRNSTGAGAVMQNQIDLLLSDGPFNPQKTNSDGTTQIPPELALGTHTTNNVAIYREPSTGIVVSGTLTTTVVDMSELLGSVTMSVYRADVELTYSYRSRTYTLKRTTLRASDI
jgi:prepilin-type N-terminal cleavage/methylation domain-containing protein